jgi:hypothetical protein
LALDSDEPGQLQVSQIEAEGIDPKAPESVSTFAAGAQVVGSIDIGSNNSTFHVDSPQAELLDTTRLSAIGNGTSATSLQVPFSNGKAVDIIHGLPSSNSPENISYLPPQTDTHCRFSESYFFLTRTVS